MGRRRFPIREVIEILEIQFGKPEWYARYEPMDELVCCILSQHSNDATSFPTFDRLKETYKEWDVIAHLPVGELADAIRKAGLANQKAKSIQGCLHEIKRRNGDYTLEPLRDMPMAEGRAWLESLPGVGPKTASIVLAMAMNKPAIPVDTHVFRVSWRLGLFEQRIGEAKAHDVLLDLVPTDLTYRFHVALIQHGRTTCKALKPKCDSCPVSVHCQWFRKGGSKG